MADVADVTSTLAAFINGLIYPNGTSQPSVGGVDARVFAGWPVPATLAADLEKGTVEVSVYPLPGERNTTRYLPEWQQASMNTPTLSLFAAGQTVLVQGIVPPRSNPHNAVIFANGIPYVYAVQPTDSLNSIASALATLIAVAIPGTASAGPLVSLPASARLGAVRIGVTGTVVNEVSRQEKQFSVIVWADTPQHRTAIAKVIDLALKKMTFLALPDLSAGRIRYVGNRETDTAQKQGLYRRDLTYTVEYGTFDTEVATQITQIGITVAVEPDASAIPETIFTVYE